MRVLYLTGEFPPLQGGVGDCTNEIAKALVECGAETHVLTTADHRPPTSHRESGVFVHRLVDKWDWGSLPMVWRVVRDSGPAVVHIQYQTGAFGMHPAINFLPRYLGRRAVDLGRAPRRGLIPRPCTVLTFHDLRVPYLFPKAGSLRQWVTEYVARSSDAVIATNEQDYMRLRTWGLKRLDLIPIGSNIPTALPPNYHRREWRAGLGVDEKETLLCYFGFLNESKGGETLVRALVHIPDAKLLMVGGQVGASDPTNVAYLARVKNLIAELGLMPRVLWTGYTPASEVSANLIASDICVLPYRDGASFRRGSFMAALAHGLPIVTTAPPSPVPPSLPRSPSTFPSPAAQGRSPATPAEQVAQDDSEEGEGSRPSGVKLPVLRDGENVLLVPPDDPIALAEALSRLASAPELRAQLSRGARELAGHFTWEKIAAQHIELYKFLTESKSPA